MDPSLRSNGSNTRPSIQAPTRTIGRSRVAGGVDRVLNTALAGGRAAVLNATAAELLADSQPVARVIESALGRPGVGVIGHWMVQELFRRSSLYDELLNALVSPHPATRAAAARLRAAARMTDSVLRIGDLLDDPKPLVREAAVRSLGQLGGRRAVELLMASSERIPVYRLAIALARAASDAGIEAPMRQPPSERAAWGTLLAFGLRRARPTASPA